MDEAARTDRWDDLARAMPAFLWTTNERGIITYASPATVEALELTVGDDALHLPSIALSAVSEAVSRAIDGRRSTVRTAHGKDRLIASVAPLLDGAEIVGTIATAVLYDEGADRDALLTDRLEMAIARGARSGEIVTVVALELDQFNDVVDSFGFAIADSVVEELVRRLEEAMRPSDTVIRRFAQYVLMVLPDVREPAQVPAVFERLRRLLDAPFLFAGEALRLTLSGGIALLGTDANDPETLIECAFRALHRARSEGTDSFRFHSEEMQNSVRMRMIIDQAVRRTTSAGEFDLAYQPIVSLSSGRVIGFEALLRPQDHVRTLIGTRDFISAAEGNGSIIALDQLVLERALADIGALARAKQRRIDLNVNLSARHFSDRRLVSTLAAVIAAADFDPEWLELELTETELLADFETALRTIADIRALGVRVAIDDFGTGYNSLLNLRHLAVSTIKIDTSFIHGIGFDPHAEAIVRAIINLAHELHLSVVAEGVESSIQRSFLRAAGCDAFQGFAFSAGIALADCAAFIDPVVHDVSRVPGLLAPVFDGLGDEVTPGLG